MPPNSPSQRSSRIEAAIIAGILAIALILRVINLDAQLWYDEVLTLIQSVRLPPAELFVSYGSLNNHVLYTWLAKAAVALFGEHPWSLRLPAVIFGVASIAAVWALFRESSGKWMAALIALLLALSYHHVWFSQNARGYTGLLLFTTLAGLSLHRGITTGRRTYWFAYALFFATSMLIHLSAAFLLFAHGVAAIARATQIARRKSAAESARWLLGGPVIGFGAGAVIVAAALVPTAPEMIESFGAVAGPPAAATLSVAEWKNPFWTAAEIVRSLGLLGVALPVAVIFACIGSWRIARATPWIALPYLIHIPVTIGILLALSMRVWPRYFFVDLGFVLAATVFGAFAFADFIGERFNTRGKFGVSAHSLKLAGSAFMAAASAPLLFQNYAKPKQDFEGALAFIESRRQSGDRIATIGLADLYYRDYRELDWPTIEPDASLGSEAPQWLVSAFPAHVEANYPRAAKALEEHYEVAARFTGTLSGGDILVYRASPQ